MKWYHILALIFGFYIFPHLIDFYILSLYYSDPSEAPIVKVDDDKP